MRKFIMSYSCGKDSTLALYRMIKNGHIPASLLVTVNKSENRSWFHGVPEALIKKVSNSLNIPVILVESKGDNYASTFTEALIHGKKNLGVDSCVFGDIDLEERLNATSLANSSQSQKSQSLHRQNSIIQSDNLFNNLIGLFDSFSI